MFACVAVAAASSGQGASLDAPVEGQCSCLFPWSLLVNEMANNVFGRCISAFVCHAHQVAIVFSVL